MKERPILFSTPMVQAILNGNKTQTRRNIKFQNDGKVLDFGHDWEVNEFIANCPYGKPGDILIIKELHYKFGHWERDGFTDKGSEKWKFVPDSKEVFYYDNPPEVFYKSRRKKHSLVPSWYKRNSLFMEKADARLRRWITEVGVERLNDISEEDAVAEGIEIEWSDLTTMTPMYKDYLINGSPYYSPVQSFKSLWESINGSGSWEENPYVWVIKFERI